MHALFPGPNSGWSEAAAAGALNLQLIGPVWRNGEMVTDLWIGPVDGRKDPGHNDLRKMIFFARVNACIPVCAATAFMPTIPLLFG